MWTDFYRALTAVVDLLLPPACLLCGQSLPAGDDRKSFCRTCRTGMSPLGPAHCPLCAQPFPYAPSNHLCGTCLRQPPPFAAVHAVGLYQGTIRVAVQRLKYHHQVTLAQPLGQLLAGVVSSAPSGFAPHRIVPVPLHPKRLKKRGYNQALELARPLARALRAPLDTGLLQRVRMTPPQQGLTATERKRNLHEAFQVNPEVAGLRVLLVDDVMTTGETVRECSRKLLLGGAAEIQVAVVGRA